MPALGAATLRPRERAMDVPNGVAAAISDRDFIAFTFKTTF